jgi:energy-coupling factor transporter ATP-binding protein EcfA2
MTIIKYHLDQDLKMEILKNIQHKHEIIIDRDLINSSWINFQKKLEILNIPNDDIYSSFSVVLDIPLYKEDKIIYKNSNLALSETTIYCTNPKYINETNTTTTIESSKKYEIGLIDPETLSSIKIGKKKYINNEFKIKKMVTNQILNSINDGFSKVEAFIKNDLIIISKYKNNKKILHNINIKSTLKEDFFDNIEDIIENSVKDKYIIEVKNNAKKITIKSESVSLDYLELLKNGKDKDILSEIVYASNKSRGIIFVGGTSGMGKTSFLRGLSKLITEKDTNKEILFIKDASDIKGSLYADVIFIDIENPTDFISEITEMSLMGSLVIVSLVSSNSIHTLKILKYKSKEDKNLFADEIIGVYHQVMIPGAILEDSIEKSVFDLKEYKLMLNYKNRPNPNDKILTSSILSNVITDNMVLCEWLVASELIKNSLSGVFDEKEIIMEKRGEEWLDMSENALILLLNKKITINDFLKNLTLL